MPTTNSPVIHHPVVKESQVQLKDFLFDTYDGFADKRVTDRSKSLPFKIDDQDERIRRDTCTTFCQIRVHIPVPNVSQFYLKLTHAPHDQRLEKFLKTTRARYSKNTNSGLDISIFLGPDDAKFIRDLARQMYRLTRRRKFANKPNPWYADPNWAWMADRVAASLNRLADHLDNFVAMNRNKSTSSTTESPPVSDAPGDEEDADERFWTEVVSSKRQACQASREKEPDVTRKTIKPTPKDEPDDLFGLLAEVPMVPVNQTLPAVSFRNEPKEGLFGILDLDK